VGASPPHPQFDGYKLKVVPINRKHTNPLLRIFLPLVVSNFLSLKCYGVSLSPNYPNICICKCVIGSPTITVVLYIFLSDGKWQAPRAPFVLCFNLRFIGIKYFCINSSILNQSARSASGFVYVTNCISIRKRLTRSMPHSPWSKEQWVP
jgi:hypothetical protein